MNQDTEQIITEVVKKTESDLILFFVLAIVALLIVAIPLYRMVLDDRKRRTEHESKREGRILDVISRNSEVVERNTAALYALAADIKRHDEHIDKKLEELLELVQSIHSHY
jgi:uncharacterized protein HemX